MATSRKGTPTRLPGSPDPKYPASIAYTSSRQHSSCVVGGDLDQVNLLLGFRAYLYGRPRLGQPRPDVKAAPDADDRSRVATRTPCGPPGIGVR
jgi:hypothetical protein